MLPVSFTSSILANSLFCLVMYKARTSLNSSKDNLAKGPCSIFLYPSCEFATPAGELRVKCTSKRESFFIMLYSNFPISKVYSSSFIPLPAEPVLTLLCPGSIVIMYFPPLELTLSLLTVSLILSEVPPALTTVAFSSLGPVLS